MLKVPISPFTNPALLSKEELQENIQYCKKVLRIPTRKYALLEQYRQLAELELSIDMQKDAKMQFCIDSKTFYQDTGLKATYNDQEFTCSGTYSVQLYDSTPDNAPDAQHLYILAFAAKDASLDLPTLAQYNQCQFWALPDTVPVTCTVYCMMTVPNDESMWVQLQYNDKYALNLYTPLYGTQYANTYYDDVPADLYNMIGKDVEMRWTFRPGNRPDDIITYF